MMKTNLKKLMKKQTDRLITKNKAKKTGSICTQQFQSCLKQLEHTKQLLTQNFLHLLVAVFPKNVNFATKKIKLCVRLMIQIKKI